MSGGGLFGRAKSLREGRAPASSGEPAPMSCGEPAPGASADADARTARLQERIAGHNRELLRLRAELRAAKAGTRQHKFYAKRAAQVLAQKKALEKRLATAVNARYNLAVAQDEADAAAEMAAMQHSRRDADELRNTSSMLAEMRTTPEDVDQVVEDIRERMREVEEVTLMLGRDDLFDDGAVDEQELEEELMREMQDMPPVEQSDQLPPDDEYLKRLEQLMPAPNQATPQPYRPPPRTNEGQGSLPRQQKPTRRGGA